MSATFGDDIRDQVVSYFRRRATDIVAAFSQLLVDEQTTTHTPRRATRPTEAESQPIDGPALDP